MASIDTGGVGGKGSRRSHDFELNITSIIDCFVVLISFLLISSSFLAIGMLDAGIQAGQVAPEAATPPPVQISVEMEAGNRLRVKLTGKATENLEIPAISGKWDLESLTRKLTEVRKAWPAVDGATLSAQADVEYRDVVRGMEAVRKQIPNVLLGGF